MTFESGHVAWNKGRKCPQISEALKGHVSWWKGKKRPQHSEAMRGHPVSDVTKQKMSDARKSYLQAHPQRGSNHPMFGKKHSEATRRRLSETKRGENHPFFGKKRPEHSKRMSGNGNPMYGEHHSEASREKMSETKRARYQKELHPNYGKHLSKKTREKISQGNKGKNAGEKNYWYGKHHSEETKSKIREKRLKRVYPTRDTSIEVKIQDELRRRGVAFQTHVPLCGICQPGVVIPEKRIVIHCDGDYWHSLPENQIRDKNQDKILRKAGLKVYRFWEHEINKNVSACVDQIMA